MLKQGYFYDGVTKLLIDKNKEINWPLLKDVKHININEYIKKLPINHQPKWK